MKCKNIIIGGDGGGSGEMSQMYTKEVEVLGASVVPNTKEEDIATKNTTYTQ